MKNITTLFLLTVTVYTATAQVSFPTLPNCGVVSAEFIKGNEHDQAIRFFKDNDSTFLVHLITQSTEGDIAAYGCHNVYRRYPNDYSSLLQEYCALYDSTNLIGGMGKFYHYLANGNVILFGVSPSPIQDVAMECHAPDSSILWYKTYGGSGPEACHEVSRSPDGKHFYIASGTYSTDRDVNSPYGGVYSDIWILKVDTMGDTLWTKVYGGTYNDGIVYIEALPDGGCLLIGSSESMDYDCVGNHGGMDLWIMRIDSMGNRLWNKMLGGSGYDEVDLLAYPSVIQDGAGGYYIAASSTSGDGDVQHDSIPGKDFWLLHIDSMANIIWERTYGSLHDDWDIGGLAMAADGTLWLGATLTGHSIDSGHIDIRYGAEDGWVLHIDSLGNFINQLVIGTRGMDKVNSIQPLPDSTVLVCGSFSSQYPDGAKSYGMPWDNPYPGNHLDGFILRLSPESVPLGLSPLHNAAIDWSVYPNPPGKDKKLIIDMGSYKEAVHYQLTAMNGQVLGSGIVQGKKEVTLPSLPPGTYWMTIYNESYKDSKQITLNH